jgi:hypothetical protein
MPDRTDRMTGALVTIFVAAAAGLFVPDDWRPFVFAVILLLAVGGLYDESAQREAGGRALSEHHDRDD